MIDFRYHLVSIVSIFLALAVGIVLGAGPLKEDIGNTLTSEVKNLRDDKAALRAELDSATKGNQARDDFTAASNRTLLSGRLTGTTVSVVVLPGAEGALVKSTTDTLTAAGAKIGSTVTVLDSWIDPGKASFRSSLGQQLAHEVEVPAGQSSGDVVVDQVLARAIEAKPGTTPAPGATAALESLRNGDLVRYTPDHITPGTVAVVVAGPVTGPDAATRDTRAQALSAIAGAMDSAGAGAVLVAPTLPVTVKDQGSVVATVRANGDIAKVLTTVDDGDVPMGQASVVLGLIEQESGKSGHYGLAGDADATFPQLTTK
ncbi:MAG TPA: copper transporter [Pedococcus sp.]|nr:copper transporter [Pedococcus sp.]